MKLTLHGLLITLAALLVAFIALRFALDPGYTFEEVFSDANIYFHTSRVTVFQVGGCVEAEWRVENIGAIFFNGQPTVGEGYQTACTVFRQAPTLHIVFQDGSTRDFVAPIHYWIEQPETLAMVVAAIVLLISGLLVALTSRGGSGSALQPGETVRREGIASRLLKGVGLVSLALIITILLLEIGLRGYFTFFGSDLQKISFLYSRAEIEADIAASTIPLPGIDYSLSPFREGNNDLGYRGEEITVPKPDDIYRIIVLGASEVYGFTPNDQTFPAQLQRVLRDDYGYNNVEVVNGGIIGYTSWQVFSNFSLHALEIDPDLAILYINGNDIDRREMSPDCYRGANVLRGLDPSGRVSTDSGLKPLSPFVLVRFLSINLGWESDPADFDSRSAQVDTGCDRDAGTPAENIAANPPIYFRRNLENLIAVAQTQDVGVMVSSWAYWKGTDEAEDHWRAAVEEQNLILRDVADEAEVPFFDYEPVAPQDRAMWSDYVHPNGDGSGAQAEAFAAYLDELAIIPK